MRFITIHFSSWGNITSGTCMGSGIWEGTWISKCIYNNGTVVLPILYFPYVKCRSIIYGRLQFVGKTINVIKRKFFWKLWILGLLEVRIEIFYTTVVDLIILIVGPIILIYINLSESPKSIIKIVRYHQFNP